MSLVTEGKGLAQAPPGPPMWQEALRTASVVVRQEAFWVGAAFVAALGLCFWPLFAKMPGLWFAPETYYNHAPLVPLMAAYMVNERWSAVKDRPVRPFYLALVPLGLLLYANYIAMSAPRDMLMSVAFIGTLLLGVLFVAGWGWLRALFVPVLFLLFGLPVWEQVIDVYTQPLQAVSSELAHAMLSGVGFTVVTDPTNVTTLYLDHFQMYVGVPCSGLRTILAMATLVAFVVVIGKLRWWANLVLIALAVPLCVLVNGIRISMIGAVGNLYGSDAGHQFHDYSGYISIALLMFLLYKLSQRLGLKV